MSPAESKSSTQSEITIAIVSMIAGLIPVLARYYLSHPDELNIMKRQIARYLYRKCERLTLYWWDKSLSCAQYYNRLKP